MSAFSIENVLLELSRAPGVAGRESAAVAVAARYLREYVDEVSLDNFGNLIALKKGEGKGEDEGISLAYMAHIDEIGLMVTKIEEGGFLRFTTIGGIDPRTLLGQAVEVHGKSRLKGVIGALSPHLLTYKEQQKELKVENLFIDLGFSEEHTRAQVSVGDFISLEQEPQVLEGGRCLTGKALDNRAGVAAMIYCAKELAGYRHSADIYFVASLQEEIGLRGAITAAYGLAPHVAVAVDVTHGSAPGITGPKVFELMAGPTLAMGPNIHPAVFRKLQELAREYRIPYQPEAIAEHSGTDAYMLQISREGIPTGLLSLPLRYMHSAVELLNLEDLNSTGRLMACLARSVDPSFVEGLSCF